MTDKSHQIQCECVNAPYFITDFVLEISKM